MNLKEHPELLERLAAHYALGTLRGGARRRFESMAREQAPMRAMALIWQSRLSSLNELQVQVSPPAAVWTRIDNQVMGSKVQAAIQANRKAQAPAFFSPFRGLFGWLGSVAFWRGVSLAGAVATVAAVTVGMGMRQAMGTEISRLQAALRAAPNIEYMAVLADHDATTSMLVTFDPTSKNLTLQRVSAFQEAHDQSLQLWALPRNGGPKSLGVLSGAKLLNLTAVE